MSCIVGIKIEDRVFIGADSLLSGFNVCYPIKNSKVFQMDDFVIGLSGSPRAAQLLECNFKIDISDETFENDPYLFMCTVFIDGVRSLFKEKGYSTVEDNKEGSGSCFLVGIKNRLFEVEGDFQVNEPFLGYAATGSGESFALGSLITTDQYMDDPLSRIWYALEAAEFFNPYVRKPFVARDTLGNFYEYPDP